MAEQNHKRGQSTTEAADVISNLPVCSNELAVTRLHCGAAGRPWRATSSVGRFGRLTLSRPSCSTASALARNLREMERELGIATNVRSRVGRPVRALGSGHAPTRTIPEPNRHGRRRGSDGPNGRYATRTEILEPRSGTK